MDLEREFIESALHALGGYLHLLPTEVQRKINIGTSLLERGVTTDEIRQQVGSNNWVIARRSKRIVDKYGKDVVCLTPSKFEEIQRKAIEARY